jgi:hypothetical protein
VEHQQLVEKRIFLSGEPAEKSFHPRNGCRQGRANDSNDSEETAKPSFNPVETIAK